MLTGYGSIFKKILLGYYNDEIIINIKIPFLYGLKFLHQKWFS